MSHSGLFIRPCIVTGMSTKTNTSKHECSMSCLIAPTHGHLFWEVMVVHADGCECLQQHWRCMRPYQHNGNAHNLCMFWEPSTDVFVRPSKHNTRSHLLANVSLSCVCVFLWFASWPWFGSKLLARSAVLQEVLLSLRFPSGSLFFWPLTWCLLQGRRHRTVPPSPRHCGQAE